MMSQFDASHYEEVLGTRGRSGEQMDIFMAVFGPAGSDGYPKLLYDKWTGVIDKSVADYWRDHYDLRHIVERDWKTLGPKLVGKLHIFMGDQDTFLLEEATFKLQEFLESTKEPVLRAAASRSANASRTATRACPSSRASAPSSASFRR